MQDTDKPQESPGTGGQSQWRQRLRAWWDGDVLPPAPSAPAAAAGPASAEDAGDAKGSVKKGEPVILPAIKGWPDNRRFIVQELFGEGMIAPGGHETIRRLIKPLELNDKMTVVDLGSGMGAVTRFIAQEYGVWATGYEPDGELAVVAKDISTRLGVAQKAMVKSMPLESLQLKPASIDAVIAREAFFTQSDMEKLFTRIRRALKDGGQFTFFDFLRNGDAGNPGYMVWAAHEPVEPHALSPEEVQAMLEGLGFTIRTMEDCTLEYRSAILTAFATYAVRVKDKPADDTWYPWLLAETEHWTRRVNAMDSGDVRVYRCHAVVPGSSAAPA